MFLCRNAACGYIKNITSFIQTFSLSYTKIALGNMLYLEKEGALSLGSWFYYIMKDISLDAWKTLTWPYMYGL